MKKLSLPGRTLEPHEIAQTFQGSAGAAERSPGLVHAMSYTAEVLAVYSEKMACDIRTWNGSTKYMVPIRTVGGLNSSNEVWGEVELPAVGDTVIVEFLEDREGMPMITGTVLPFYNKHFQGAQVAANSGSKAFTKKLLEASKPKTYRRIFKSGTTVEIQENGTIILESPSGSVLNIKESNGQIDITASGGVVNINGNTKYLVTHSELNTALQSFLTALKAAVSAQCQSGSGASIASVTLDISSAQASKVKTS
jgi:hypothetical protein